MILENCLIISYTFLEAFKSGLLDDQHLSRRLTSKPKHITPFIVRRFFREARVDSFRCRLTLSRNNRLVGRQQTSLPIFHSTGSACGATEDAENID